jgi:hypothetical protein
MKEDRTARAFLLPTLYGKHRPAEAPPGDSRSDAEALSGKSVDLPVANAAPADYNTIMQ